MHSRRGFLKTGLWSIGAISSLGWRSPEIQQDMVPCSVQPGSVGDELDRLQEYLNAKQPTVWLFTGDSITQGAKHTHGWRAYQEVFAERVRWELGRVRDVVINTAVSGNTTADLLADAEWRIIRFKPQVVSVMMGTNDCADTKNITPMDFERNLIRIVDVIRGTGAIPLLHVPAPIIIEKANERRRIAEYADVVRMVADSRQVVAIDHWLHWQSAMDNKGEKQVFADWLNDPLHPNGTGHLEMARLLFKRLQIFDPKAPTCGAPYYEGDH